MKRHPEIWQELKAVAPGLADAGQQSPQRLPEDYFDLFPGVIMARIRGEALKPFAAAQPQQDLPSGYFEGLAGRILSKLSVSQPSETARETAELTPTLAGLDRSMPQQVPAGYFDHLAETLVERRSNKAPVIRMRFTRVIRLAAAAVVAGILFSGAWFIMHDRDTVDHGDSHATVDSSAVSEKAMAAYLDQTQALDELDPSTPETAKPEDVTLLNLDDNKLGEILSTMSDKEISDYVKSDPTSSPNVMEN